MKPQSKQTPRIILSSVDEYEFRNLNTLQIKKIEQNLGDQIFLFQKSNDRNQMQRASMKVNNKNRSPRKKSQRYLNGNKQKNAQLFFSKTYGQNFFSCSKKVTQRQEAKQTHKTISTYEMLTQNQRDPRVVQLALRYGILNKKSKNSFNEILKKRSKKSNNLNINQFFDKKNQKISIDSNIDQKFQKALLKNKKNLESVNQNPNKYDQNFSLMLDRKRVLQSAKQHETDQIYGNFSMSGPKKQFSDNIKITQKKNGHKIQVFINEKIERETNHLKNKVYKKQMAKTCYNQFSNQKDLLKSNYIDVPLQKQPKILNNNWSNKIYFPQNQRTIKQASFSAVKNTTERIEHKNKIEQKKQLLKGRKSDIDCNRRQSKIQIIPDSIIFKKKQSSENKKIAIGKIMKNISRQISSGNQSSQIIKKFQKSQNSINLLGNIESKLFLQKKIFSKECRPSTQGSPSRQSRKQNYPTKNQQFTFIFDSKDHSYIPQYLIANGWVPFGTNKLNSDYTLRWVNNPVISQIMKLKDGQFYNHFHKSFQLTSKSFLSSNLRANQHFLKMDYFFPQTYDIGNQMERNQFIKRFKYNVIISLLENVVSYCFEKGKISHLMKKDMQIEDLSDNIDFQSEKIFQNQSFNVIEFQNYRNKDRDFQINIFLTILVIKYLRKEKTKHFIDFKEKKNHFLRFKKDQFENNFQTLEFYSKQQNVSQSQDSKGLFSYHFATPSDLMLQILVNEYAFFQKLNKWKNNLRSGAKNSSNIWIIKPSSNARGNGIYLETNLGSILKSAKDIQSRIIQKYVEKPLLFKKTPYPHLNNHKFDIRQWVLLKSLDPLEIYMFSHFYIRLASEKYELYPIENNKVHLTNFSANKQFFDNQQDSIVNSDEFINFLEQEFGISWQEVLKPKVKEIIIKSIQSCQEKLQVSQNGTCFELLGYDIFIDEQFHPWLIEVNMSPACQQRTEWLADYIKNMNEQLLEIILPQTHISKKPSSRNRSQKWEKIYFQEYHSNAKECNSKLEIVSTNLQIKNKLSKQNQAINSRKSIQGSRSPNKLRLQNPIKKTIRKKSATKVKKIVDQEKQTLNEQKKCIKTISQIDLDPQNESIQFEDFIENQKINQNQNQKLQLLDQIEQISQDMNDSFEKSISQEQELFENFQEQIMQNGDF